MTQLCRLRRGGGGYRFSWRRSRLGGPGVCAEGKAFALVRRVELLRVQATLNRFLGRRTVVHLGLLGRSHWRSDHLVFRSGDLLVLGSGSIFGGCVELFGVQATWNGADGRAAVVELGGRSSQWCKRSVELGLSVSQSARRSQDGGVQSR